MSNPQPAGEPSLPDRRISAAGWLCELFQHPTFRGDGWRILAFAAVVNLVLFAAFFALATPGYETNDDLSMQLIASGFYTGQPSEYLVFTNVLIGWPLRVLYGLWNGNNWYFIYLNAVHYLSLTAVAFVVFSRRRTWPFILLYAGYFLLVEVRILLKVQFTTSAFLAGASGVLLLVDGLRVGRPVHWPRVLSGLGLITLMGMIREAVVPFLGIVALPFLLERVGIAGWRRLVWIGLACGTLFVVIHGINRWYYERDPDWAEFSAYNRLRGQFHGTPLEVFASRAAPAAGWSENDVQMFARYYLAEPEVYAGSAKLHRFVEALKDSAEAEPSRRKFSARQLHLLAKQLYQLRILDRDSTVLSTLALLNGAWCLFAAGTSRRRYLLTLVVIYAVSLALASYLLATARFPPRVAYNLPLFMHLVCLYWASNFEGSRMGFAFSRVSSGWFLAVQRGCVLGSWLILYVWALAGLHQNLRAANNYYSKLEKTSARIDEPIKALLPAGQRPVLIAIPDDSVLEQGLLYRPSGDVVPFSLVPYGWLSQSPLFRQILNRHRLDPYSLSLIERQDVFFLMGRQDGWLKPLMTFYREHYGLDISFEAVLNTDTMPQFFDCHLLVFRANTVGSDRVKPAPP